MTYEEFFDYVFNEDLMNKDIICVNNNQIYKRLYDDILKEPKIHFLEELNISFCSFEDYYSYKMKKPITRIIQMFKKFGLIY